MIESRITASEQRIEALQRGRTGKSSAAEPLNAGATRLFKAGILRIVAKHGLSSEALQAETARVVRRRPGAVPIA